MDLPSSWPDTNLNPSPKEKYHLMDLEVFFYGILKLYERFLQQAYQAKI